MTFNWSTTIFLIVISSVLYLAAADASTSTTPPSIDEECRQHNNSCKSCVANPKCLWCESLSTRCIPYPAGSVIPSSDVCKLSDAKWGVCWVNYEILLIAMGCVAGVIIISLCLCIYCCCCRSKGSASRRYAEEEARIESEREQRRSRNDERRAQRQSRIDDIRAKYGLTGGSSGYRRFDNDSEVV